MRAYRQTYRRHRRLLIAPILIAAAVAGWFTFGAAPAYRSTAALWVDNGSSAESSLNGMTVSEGPAGFEAEVLGELLTTPEFDLAVGHGSELPGFLAAGGSAGGFSPTVLLSRGSGGSPDTLAAESVGTQVRTVLTGPQVLRLTYTGPSAAVAQSVLRSLIKQLRAGSFSNGDNLGKTAAVYYQRQLASATWGVQNSRESLADYARNHMGATEDNDPTYAALAAEVEVANAKLSSVQADSAVVEAEAQGNGEGATIEVLDPPSLPSGPTTGPGTKLVGTLGGVFAGFLMSLLTLIVLTPRPQRRWDEDVPLFGRIGARRSRTGVHPQQGGA